MVVGTRSWSDGLLLHAWCGVSGVDVGVLLRLEVPMDQAVTIFLMFKTVRFKLNLNIINLRSYFYKFQIVF